MEPKTEWDWYQKFCEDYGYDHRDEQDRNYP